MQLTEAEITEYTQTLNFLEANESRARELQKQMDACERRWNKLSEKLRSNPALWAKVSVNRRVDPNYNFNDVLA